MKQKDVKLKEAPELPNFIGRLIKIFATFHGKGRMTQGQNQEPRG